jgi:hypothetical protein
MSPAGEAWASPELSTPWDVAAQAQGCSPWPPPPWPAAGAASSWVREPVGESTEGSAARGLRPVGRHPALGAAEGGRAAALCEGGAAVGAQGSDPSPGRGEGYVCGCGPGPPPAPTRSNSAGMSGSTGWIGPPPGRGKQPHLVACGRPITDIYEYHRCHMA